MKSHPWYASYPKGVPHEIDPDRYPSLAEFLEDCFNQYNPLPAYENMGKILTYKEIDQLSRDFASYLLYELKLQHGDRIAIQMPNLLQYPVVMFGALRAGLTIVNTNPLYTPSEMLHQFNDSGAKVIVILENFASHLQQILDQTKIEHILITRIGDMIGGLKGAIVNFVVKKVKKMVPDFHLPTAIPLKRALASGGQHTFKKVSIQSEELAFLQYTGGTTGVSKGAMLTHRNLIANLEQAYGWMAPSGLKDTKEIVITALPLYHIFALTANALVAVRIGAKNVLITNPRDMNGFVKELSKHKYSFITGVNTLLNGLLNNPGFAKIDHSNLKLALAGGMALQRAVAEKWEAVTGVRVAEAYGLTETSPGACINPLDGNIRIGSIGLPLSSTDIKLLDEEGQEVAQGERGELCIKGPQVMKGYWNRPKETEECFINGYFKTGDIAQMEKDGFFKIVDRKKEMILVSGFNVYPNEVEDCVALHPKVLEVGAIGVPDKKSTEAVKIYVVKKDPSLTEEELRAHCKERLTGYKCPKYIAFTDELPKSNIGKIMRRLIKEEDLKVNAYG